MDMAWCADSLPKDPGLPMVVSLHATKALGCGEGGVVVSENEEESNP